MLLQQAQPGTRLDQWVHSYRQYTFTPGDDSQFNCLPGTGAEFWVLLSGKLGFEPDQSRGSLGHGLLCLRSRRLEFQQTGLRVFSIRFRAGSLPFFTHQPFARLIDRYSPVNTFWDEDTVLQLNPLQRSPHFEEQCFLAERFLLSRLRAVERLENMQQLAAVIYEESADFALGNYADRVRRDRSHLSRQFHETQGVSAKYFHRLCRFERFLRDALFAKNPSLAGLATDHGYYDQAHMSNDVRQLSQQSPGSLLSRNETRLFYSQRFNPDSQPRFHDSGKC